MRTLLWPMLCLLVSMVLGAPLPGPLVHALKAAKEHNRSILIARARQAQEQAGRQGALGALLPSAQLTGSYTRNQYSAVIPVSTTNIALPGVQTLVIIPTNQWTGGVAVNVPLIQPLGWVRYARAGHSVAQAAAESSAAEDDALLATARAYYAVISTEGVLAAARRAAETARQSLDAAKVRVTSGAAPPLNVSRAQVDVARAEQSIALARQNLGNARRNLETLTGETFAAELPEPWTEEVPQAGAAELAYLEQAQRRRPEIAQALSALAEAELSRREAWLALAPAVNGIAQEHFTNATGFTGQPIFWTAGAALTWTLDPAGTTAAVHRASAVVEEQQQRVAQTREAVRDDVHAAWLQLEADSARVVQAKAEAESAAEAMQITAQQYRAGAATSVDLSSAQRDAFNAEAGLVQARADAAVAVLALRRAAGESLLEGP